MKRSIIPRRPFLKGEEPSPVIDASFRSDCLIRPAIFAGMITNLSCSGELASSSTVPMLISKSITLDLVSASGVPATPKSMLPEIAPAAVPLLLALTSVNKSVRTL